MKTIIFLKKKKIQSLRSLAKSLVVLVCLIVGSMFAKDQQVIVTVSNPIELNRPNETIAIPWNALKQYLPTLDSTNVLVLDAKTNNELVTQVMNDDRTNAPQELIFQSSIGSKEVKQFIVQAVKRERKIITSLTDARFMVPREDVAWENDRIAHRMYGPALAKESNNGIDVWTKRVRYLIVEKWYHDDELPGSARLPYHIDRGEGADFYDVGRSLGDGSCALYENDSLYQPGVFETHKILSTGPIRAKFEVTYKPVIFHGRKISEVKRISLDAGSNLNKIEVTYRCDSVTEKVPFAVGNVKRKGVLSYKDSERKCVSLWGATNDNAENGALGTGIVMPKEYFFGIKEDNKHVLILGTIALNKTATYFAGAGWTRSGDFHSADDWNKYLKEYSERLEAPLQISLSVGK